MHDLHVNFSRTRRLPRCVVLMGAWTWNAIASWQRTRGSRLKGLKRGCEAISYRDMQTTQRLQYGLVAFQLAVLVLFAVTALVRAGGTDLVEHASFEMSWLNPFEVASFSLFAAGVSLSIFIFWGWDVTLTMNEETKNPEKTPGRAAALTVVVIVTLYLLIADSEG